MLNGEQQQLMAKTNEVDNMDKKVKKWSEKDKVIREEAISMINKDDIL